MSTAPWKCPECGGTRFILINWLVVEESQLVCSTCKGGPKACESCTAEASCKAINQCLRYKCEFGKVDKP